MSYTTPVFRTFPPPSGAPKWESDSRISPCPVCRKFAADCPNPNGSISNPYVYIIQVIVILTGWPINSGTSKSILYKIESSKSLASWDADEIIRLSSNAIFVIITYEFFIFVFSSRFLYMSIFVTNTKIFINATCCFPTKVMNRCFL